MPTDPSENVPQYKFPEWQPQFQDAVVEFDPRKLPFLVEVAATAIILRLQSRQTSPEELRALANAFRSPSHDSVHETGHSHLCEARTMRITQFAQRVVRVCGQ